MVFSSTTFLLAFLPLVGILYFICPKKLRNALLLVFSLLFYGWGEPKYILIMLFSTVFDYCNGLAIGWFRRRQREKGAKGVLILSVVGNLAILGFFKYTDFAINNINGLLGTAIPALGLLLPIGISFYTFQTMSYTIDVYRGLVPPQRNIIDFGAYVTLFPQLIAGPIVQYKTVAYDLEHRRENLAEASEGLQRLVKNGFQFTESDRAKRNRELVKRDNNNVFDFLESEGYIRLKADACTSSKELYEVYKMWCEENSLNAIKARGFSDALIANQRRYNLESTNNIVNSSGRRVRGFVGIEALVQPDLTPNSWRA